MNYYSQNGLSGMLQSSALDQYVERLRNSDRKKIQVPKSEVPELPPRFEENYPANEMQSEGAKASYRDDRKKDSVHAIEYEDYWQIDIDDHNPRFPEERIPHLVNDATKVAVALVVIAGLFYYSYNN